MEQEHMIKDTAVQNSLELMNGQSGILPPKGHITLWQIDEQTNEKIEVYEGINLVLYEWAWIIIKSAFHGDPTYKISGMYFEYYNVTNPGDAVTVPSYARQDQLTYYNTLASPGDFLRVPLSGLPSVTVQPTYETYFSVGQGNVANFFAQTSGTTGVLGRPFASANNSKVFGVALIATPLWSDRTQDIIFARTYFSVPNQQLKLAGSQIGVTWSIPLL